MRLIQLLRRFFSCRFTLPKRIKDDECIARCIYSAMNVDKEGKLKANFFTPRPPANGVEEGVSTVRKNHAKMDFIKYHCKCHNNPQGNRNYYGIAHLLAKNIRSCKSGSYNANIIATPTSYPTYNLPQHADIIYGFVVKRGEELPSEIKFIINELLGYTKSIKDISPQAKEWSSGEVKC